LILSKFNPIGVLLKSPEQVKYYHWIRQIFRAYGGSMKLTRLLLILGLLVVVLGFSPQSAQAGAFTYTSGFQVQNLDNTAASIQINFYNQDGTQPPGMPVSDSISSLGSKTYFPLNQVPTGFNGSVVITSTTQVAAVSNVHGNNYSANASYVAFNNGSTEVLIPLLMKNNSGYNTWFNVQNTGAVDAVVDVAYSDGTTAQKTVKPFASQTFDQALESHTLAVFSAKVTSAQPVAVTVIEENNVMMFAYNGFLGSSTNPVIPLVNANNSGFTTGVQIQNAGASSTSVTVSYTPSSAGSACTETQSISAGQSKTFTLGAFTSGTNSTCAAGAKFIGSAQVTSNSNSQPLVAVVNQHIIGTNGEAYGAFNPADASDVVVLPLIMDRNSGYWTGFNVMNVGSSSISVTCNFTNTSYKVGPVTLAAGAALTDLQNGKIASGYVGSATCKASNSADKIIAVVNELGPNGTLDQLLVYEGISVK
jgi:hypothetical protein